MPAPDHFSNLATGGCLWRGVAELRPPGGTVDRRGSAGGRSSATPFTQRTAAFLLGGLLAFNPAVAGTISGQVVLQPDHQPVPEAIVYLGAPAASPPPAAHPVIVDFQQGRLHPRVQIAQGGATLVLQNSDPTLHVVRVARIGAGTGSGVVARTAMPYAGFERRFDLPMSNATQLFQVIGENGEERQVAYLAVIPHPYAALSDREGQFLIADVPDGQYPVYVWHERLGALAGRVSITRGRSARLRFEYPLGGAAGRLPAAATR